MFCSEAIARAIKARRTEHENRTGKPIKFDENVSTLLLKLTNPMKHKVQSRYLSRRLQFQKSQTPGIDESTITEQLMTQYEDEWNDFQTRLTLVPGKELLAGLNSYLQEHYGISVTASLIIESFVKSEIPKDMLTLVEQIDWFRKETID